MSAKELKERSFNFFKLLVFDGLSLFRPNGCADGVLFVIMVMEKNLQLKPILGAEKSKDSCWQYFIVLNTFCTPHRGISVSILEIRAECKVMNSLVRHLTLGFCGMIGVGVMLQGL